MAPSLLDCLDRLARAVADPGGGGGRPGAAWSTALDVTGAVWQDVDSAEMRLHADWLLRAYGEELAQPIGAGRRPQSPATDTLALIERLLAEKDAARYALFNPGPVMTSARVKAALVHHDVCHRDEDYTGVVRRLRDQAAPGVRRLARARHPAGHRLGHGGDGDGAAVGGAGRAASS